MVVLVSTSYKFWRARIPGYAVSAFAVALPGFVRGFRTCAGHVYIKTSRRGRDIQECVEKRTRYGIT